jgi:alpha-tubulin suppressor-like RCC1 family protein
VRLINFRSKARWSIILLIASMLWAQSGLALMPRSGYAAEQNIALEQPTSIYKDVIPTEPNYLFINYLTGSGLLTGYPDGTFRPNDGPTRAEAATLLVRVAKLKIAGKQSGFKDVNAKYWAAANIAAVKQAGLLRGYPDGTFHPEAKLTRAEGIALLLKLTKQPDPGVSLPLLKDVNSKHWAARPIAIALASGMVGLTVDKQRFIPDAPFKRSDLSRALGVLLVSDPNLANTQLKNELKVIRGSVTVTPAGSSLPLELKGSTQLKSGDIIKTGPASSGQLIFPDGSGFLLKENTNLQVKELQGRSYIKVDGTPGISVDGLSLDLKQGRLLGALATSVRTTTANPEDVTNKTVVIASLEGKLFKTTAMALAAKPNQSPWWQTYNTKKVKVKVDMPWGMAAVRGTFWENAVEADGRNMTNVLTGEVEVSAGYNAGQTDGRAVLVKEGQRTEIISSGAAPNNPVPMTLADRQLWAAEREWAVERAKDIQSKMEQELPPPPVVTEKPGQLPPVPIVPPVPTVKPDITANINQTLNQLINTTTNNNEGTGSGSTTPTPLARLSSDPLNTALDVPIDKIININFNRSIQKGSSFSSITLKNGETVVAYTYSISGSTLAITPVSPLAYNTAYVVSLPVGAVQDLAGIALASSVNLGFTTIAQTPLTPTIRINSVERASVSSLGVQGNGYSGDGLFPSAISADGRFVAFSSNASNLVAEDTNGMEDIFVRDRLSGTTETERVSISRFGSQGNSGSRAPAISADGRFVAYESGASNLVDGDTNGISDIFVYDRQSDKTELVSLSTSGTPSIANFWGNSYPGISSDGQYVVFRSGDDTLVSGDSNGKGDIFVRDRIKNTTVCASVYDGADSTGLEESYSPAISGNGRYVAFTTASRLTPDAGAWGIYVRDLKDNKTIWITDGSDPVLSWDGRYIAYGQGHDIHVFDRDADGDGIYAEPGLTGQTTEIIRASVPIDDGILDGYSYKPSISADGRYVAFTSHAANLVADDTNGKGDIFLRDTLLGLTKRVSVSRVGQQTTNDSWYQALSADGQFIAYTSDDAALVSNDTNGINDIFVTGVILNSTVDTTPPTAPTGLTTVDSGPSWAKLTWNSASDNILVVSYAVYRGDNSAGSFTKLATVSGNLNSYWDTSVAPDTTYYYYVLAGDEDGNSSNVPATLLQVTTPAEPAVVPRVVLASTGYELSMARQSDGSMWTWGSNSQGLLGMGSPTPYFQSTPVQVSSLTNVAGFDAWGHTLAVKKDGTVWAWGSNDSGQLGTGSLDYDSHSLPAQVLGPGGVGYLTGITAVATGESHSLALKSNGTVWAWGSNWSGALGNHVDSSGYLIDSWFPIPISGPEGDGYLTNVTAIAAGSVNSLALRGDGTVWVWGDNAYGELGLVQSDYNAHIIPTQVHGLTNIVGIAAGYSHYLALKSDGTVWAWGYNYSGQLGDGTNTDRMLPVQVTDPTDSTGYLTGVTAITAGWYHSMALKNDESVLTWGNNANGQLGDGTLLNRLTPIKVLEPSGINYLSGVSAITGDVDHSLVVMKDGTVFTWGYNGNGHLGSGTTADSSTPVQVVGSGGTGYFSNITEIPAT